MASVTTKLALSVSLALVGCGQPAGEVPPAPHERQLIGREVTVSTPGRPSPDELTRQRCAERVRAVLALPQSPGAPAFDQRRAEILARAKAEPVHFVEEPRVDDAESTSEARSYRKLLETTRYPWDALTRILPQIEGRPAVGRAALLRDGYLYAASPELAYAMVSLVRPQHLFGHDRIWVQRGEQVMHASRDKHGRYRYDDGPFHGEQVRLLHLDRIGAGEPPQRALHRDLRALRGRLGFDRAKLLHVDESSVVAELRYGKWWVTTLLSSQGAHLDFECEVVAPALRGVLDQARDEGRRRLRAVQALRAAMLDEIDEGLPFDEPHREFGFQLDGKLRKNWLHAYSHARDAYNFNGERYSVFDRRGRPLVPQVCVDFLTDTLERASGTWWAPRGEPPRRAIGKLDFDQLVAAERHEMRRAPGFVLFAEKHPEWFSVEHTTPNERAVELGQSARFYGFLADQADRFAPGDIVVIKGDVPWDWENTHTHSFFVYESDPISGVPMMVAGNAGTPSVRSWEVEARRTPKRSIHHRIRPRLDWLESIVTRQGDTEPSPISP